MRLDETTAVNRLAEIGLPRQGDKPLGSLRDGAATRYEIEGRQAQFDRFDAHIGKAAKVRRKDLQPAIGRN